MGVDDRYSLSQSASTESERGDDPFGLYLKNGRVQLMVQNEITTAGNGCSLAERSQELTENEMTLFTCEHCPYRTKYKCEFKKHFNRHVGSKNPCKDCNMPFKSLSQLNRHRRAVHGAMLSQAKRSHHCDMCPYASAYSSDIRRHENRHLAEGSYHCGHCNYPFTKFYMMLNHIRKVHGGLDKNDDRKTRSERTADDQSLTDGAGRAKETLLRRNEQTINANNSVNLNKKLSKHSDQSRNRTTHDSDKTDFPVIERSCKRLINILNCAFCGHVATSYADLKEHLDVHDDEYVDPEKNDDLFVSANNSPAKNFFVRRSVDNVDQQEELDDIDNMNNGIDLDANINSVTDDIYIATRCTDLQEQMDITDLPTPQEDIFEKISDVEQDYKDAMAMYGECVSKIIKNFADEFIVKPFACARCHFTTGNIDRLKIHVEAHLYEKAREAYSVAQRRSVEGHNETSGYLFNEMTGYRTENTSHRNITDSWNRDVEIDERSAIDKSDHEVENNVSNIENDVNVIEGTDEGFCDKDSECKQNRCTESDKKDERPSLNYIGRLSKEEFKKTKQLYRIINDEKTHAVYECSVCEYDYHFQDMNLLKEHFTQKHLDLREKICTTCKHCSKPFP